jgi:hypothetical protein
MIFYLLATRVFLWCWKINHQFIFDWLMNCPNCNLILNYAGSPCRFSIHELQDGKHLFQRSWPKNSITTLVPTDGVLLEVHNQKEGYHAWSLVATTGHVRTLGMLFYSKTRLPREIPYSFQVWLYNLTLIICLQLRLNTPLLLVIIKPIFCSSYLDLIPSRSRNSL